jgi:hypothetical protein
VKIEAFETLNIIALKLSVINANISCIVFKFLSKLKQSFTVRTQNNLEMFQKCCDNCSDGMVITTASYSRGRGFESRLEYQLSCYSSWDTSVLPAKWCNSILKHVTTASFSPVASFSYLFTYLFYLFILFNDAFLVSNHAASKERMIGEWWTAKEAAMA